MFIKLWSGLGILVCLLNPGFSGRGSSVPQSERATFAHSDELVRGDGFIILADRRMFTLMAFLNATGFDEEAQNQQMHPVRFKVRAMVADNLAKAPEKVEAWRKYCEGKKLASFQYQDFVLSLNADYPFRRIRPDSELQYPITALLLKDFPDVLNDFWNTADLERIWKQVKPDYIEEIRKYNLEKMKRQLAFLWEYLRMKRQDSYVLVNIPNLLDARFRAIGAHYDNYYYSVESPGSHAYGLNVHEYLHSIVNPLIKAGFDSQKNNLQKYYEAGKAGPLAKTYQEPITFTFECLVRALDYRLRLTFANDASLMNRVEESLASQTRQGLTLTMPFYVALADYEKSGKSFDEFVPSLLRLLPDPSPR